MPKLSKTRLINLNYNDGKRTIYNELFDYGDGKDTLFSMENGIGKTVLIQFFMQPFIRNKRELAGRRFDDYFTGSAPTYIMHEVLLDNGEKLLVGMIIKKDNSEDEKNKLRILAFMNKYSKPNDFDIINIPFVEGKRILKFSEAEEKIKKYKSGKVNFNHYNFNDSSKKAQYFEDLKAYKLNYKEWEDIIRSINNDESGLSNLYDKHKTDEALIRNVIIPLIESKINGEKNVIEAIRNNLGKYIESYKESKEAFLEVDLLKAFQGEMITAVEFLKDGVIKEASREELYKRLSFISMLSDEELRKKFNEKLQCEEFINDLNSELTKVLYEEHSLGFYKLQAKEKEAEEKLQEATDDFNDKDLKFKKLKKEKYIQESAEIYEDILEEEGELAQVRERINNFEREDSEIAQNIKNYKFTLKNIYSIELEKLKETEKALLKNKDSLKENLQKNQEEQKEAALQDKKYLSAEADAENRIKNFEKNEESFKRKYKDFILLRNIIFNEYGEKDLEQYDLSIDEKINASVALTEELTKEAASLIIKRDSIKKAINEASKELNTQSLTIEKKKNELELFNRETAKLINILTIKGLPINVALQKEKLREVLISENSKLQHTLSKKQDSVRELEDTINRYETGLIKLPKEVVESFENKGITYEYALKWLQNYKGRKEEKEALVKSNPFFPYGILLSSKDINLLKSESLDVYTSIPIPILNKSDLNKTLKMDINKDLLTIENQQFLVSFNYLLIDEEERGELLKGLRQQVKEFISNMENIQKSIYRNKEYEIALNNYPYAGSENETIEDEINSLQKAIKNLEDTLTKCNEDEIKNEKRREENKNELYEIEKNLVALKEQKESFSEFQISHEEFKKCNNELFDIKKHMEALKKKEDSLKEQFFELNSAYRDLEIKDRELMNSMKEASLRFELYKNIDTGILLSVDKNILESKLEACEKQLGEDIKRDKEDEKRLIDTLKKLENRLKRIITEGKLSEEYKTTSFSEQHLEELKVDLNTLAEQIEGLKDKINNLDKDISIIIERKQRELQDIEKLGFEGPISKEDIKNVNFRDREKKIKEDLKENNEIIKEYNEQIDKLKQIKQRLDYYKSYSNDNPDISFDFSNLDAAIIAVNDFLSTYDSIKKEVNVLEAKITKEISAIYEKYRDKNRLIKDRLFDYLNKEKKILSHSDIESLLEVVDRKARTLEMELSSIRSEEEVVINEIVRYANHVLEELKTIDKKSTIKHLNKTQKLLEISIPEEKEELALREYIKEKVQYYGSFEGEYLSSLESDIESAELLSKLIGNISRIRVDIKKIEKGGLIRKSWKEALSQNSGGEKFVSMFILLSSLMSYMRKRETDIDNKEEKKILIMDNPFAKTNAEHLLEPMFQIAEKYNIQLICFSGIGGSAVYNRFNKIYVAKVIEDKFRNKENVYFKAGSEETLELSDFTIGKEQISLF